MFHFNLTAAFLVSTILGTLYWSPVSAQTATPIETAEKINPLLPSIDSIRNMKAAQKSILLDRQGRKISEYYDQYRSYLAFTDIPEKLVQAFLAAEDEKFFEHKGISPQAILRAFIVNTQSGESTQGGSTITQQLAKNLLLTNEKSFIRKMKEAIIAYHLEKKLSKNEILELYLNQIFLGENSYGVEAAAQTYYRKSVKDLSLPEFAVLAGLPKAPSRDNPVANPVGAKERQVYVLRRMKDAGFISETELTDALRAPLRIYRGRAQSSIGHYYTDLVRQILKLKIGEERFRLGGLQIESGMDLAAQYVAEKSLRQGLLELDKRQGYREKNVLFESEEDVQKFLKQSSITLLLEKENFILNQEGEAVSEEQYLEQMRGQIAPTALNQAAPTAFNQAAPPALGEPTSQKLVQEIKKKLAGEEWVTGVVRDVNDAQKSVMVEFSEFYGVLSLDDFKWAREPNPKISLKHQEIKKASEVFTPLMKVQAQVTGWKDDKKFLPQVKKTINQLAQLKLQQEPLAEGALLSFDQKSKDLVAMVGGYDFQKSQFNRAVSARRQTGSIFKTFIAAASLEQNFTAATLLEDSPVVAEDDWRPQNHDRKFSGDVLFGVSFIRSLNLPFVKVVNEMGIPKAIAACRKLGFFSPLNPDATLVLGSSNVTVYETLRAFSEIALLGNDMNPVLIRKVTGSDGGLILQNYTMDDYYYDFMPQFQATMRSPQRGISKNAAGVMTKLLQAATKDPQATGGRAGALPFPVAGKTGTSSDYFDAWFVGASAHYSAAVWTGFDEEKSLGIGETGGRASLPIWVNYMKTLHQKLPKEEFAAAEEVIEVEVDRKTGLLPSALTKQKIILPFIKGTEPKSTNSLSEDRADEIKEY